MYDTFLYIDGDCGRGFSRIKDVCVNVSVTTAAKDDIPAKCGEIGINIEPLVTTSASLLFQLRVRTVSNVFVTILSSKLILSVFIKIYLICITTGLPSSHGR